MNDGYVFLFEEIMKMSLECGSKYNGRRVCRDDLYEFLDYNDWFGMEQRGTGFDVEVIMNRQSKEAITLWLKGYKQKAQVKAALLLEAFEGRYPETVKAFRAYIDKNSLHEENCIWQVLDFMFFNLADDTEIFDDERSQLMLRKGIDELSIAAGRLFTGFIADNNNETGKWEYRFEKRKLDDDNDAYDFRTFALMAYCVFNTEYWISNDMIRKAVDDSRYADLWLWVALHFICALRPSDMVRLPVPWIAEERETIINNLLAGDYEEMAGAIARQWSMQIQTGMTVPSKTSKYNGIPNLKVFIPESLIIPFGVMLLAILVHHKEGDALLAVNNEHYLLTGFFGNRFTEVCGKGRFSSRKANKAYLQGIEALGSDGTNAKGYMLAALARSHKGGIGTLPETTDVYLRDENFSGYKPEFILREMFERGIFGFIPVMLLRSYDEENFLKLDVHSQTKLINEIGLDGYQLERVTGMVDHALVKIRECTAVFISNNYATSDREAAGRLLEKLAADCAPSKQTEYLCLMIAAGDGCACPDRGTCLGCGYEIYTKAAFHSIVKEFRRLYDAKKDAEGIDATRYKGLMEKVITPAITQMLASMKILYKDNAEEDIMMDILEGGLTGDYSD